MSCRTRSGRKLKTIALSRAGSSRGRPVEHDGLDELVGDPARVARPHGVDRVVRLLPHPAEDRRERPVRPLPALVAVHRVVAADDRRDAVGGQRREVGHRRLGRDVAPVGEGVDPRPVLHPLALGEREQRPEVVDVRVHAALRDEAEQVHRAAALAGATEGADERLVRHERPVLDGAGHADEVLVQDPPRPDREVSDLRVPHLAVRQPDRGTGCDELRRRVAATRSSNTGVARELDGVPRPGRSDPPPVEDHERDERQPVRAHEAAARQIAANDSGSSEAPPTSAPSTAGCAISSAAFSGLTEPP